MEKNDLVIATAEFINEKVCENLSHTYGVEPMFIVDVNEFLEDLIDNECCLDADGRERMFQDVLEEIKNFNAPIDDCDDYEMYVSEDGEITFTKCQEYDDLQYDIISNIHDKVEETIKNGDWNKDITYVIEELKGHDEDVVHNICCGINQYQGGEFDFDGFNVDMKFNGYTLTYKITVDTDVNQGHLDYHLMDKLMDNGYLNHIEDIENYIKAFGDDKTLTVDHDGKEIIVKDTEQHAKVTFYISDWGRWEHTMERMEN